MGERLAFTFALTGRRNGEHDTQGVALGYELAGLSARTEPQIGLLVKRRQRPFQVGCSKSRKNPMLKLRDFGLVRLLAFNA